MCAAGKEQEIVAGDSRLLENFDKASMKPSFAFIEFPHHDGIAHNQPSVGKDSSLKSIEQKSMFENRDLIKLSSSFGGIKLDSDSVLSRFKRRWIVWGLNQDKNKQCDDRLQPIICVDDADSFQSLNNCIICDDLLLDDACCLSCGHVFHSACIRDWYKIKQHCPICEKRVSVHGIKKLYFTREEGEVSNYQILKL
ncbi:ring finger domain-containing protein [Ditylenchus destructor]|uniref:Ring finger domain-containing protein n=1 Tax=Ditylenchus destructor TaxID=166010 RepID=A0AAD4MH10_9BILA|nr:ring finger domain-containing protein [Ditylenchus destructor]